ncbi:cation:proton antiporter [Carboxylicivirga sp. RSCT41]|uniref:cation:proton antiporter domain-containing protein n=1 Tax=Carboxylicivirga agarovorans TaxID=3417570 RepID=UPI003D357755
MFLLSANIDPVVSKFVLLSAIIIIVGFVLRLIKQPSIVTYMVVGVMVGPLGFGVITDEILITNLGSLGLVLLLFFIGMEIHLPNLIASWRVSILGTALQVIISIAIIWALGSYLNWKMNQIIMIGFVISLSSTAVILKLLQEQDQLQTKLGQNVLGILLAQDILIVPMLIILGYLGGKQPTSIESIKQITGGIIIISIIIYILKNKEIRLPFRKTIAKDHEMQVFVAFTLCFGFALFTAYLELSAALGAFVGGIVLSSAKSTQWVHDSLSAFKVFFVALFFVSIGMLIDLQFIHNNLLTIGILVTLVLIVNSGINALVMKPFSENWKTSIYAGAMLSQIGEFSFILGLIGYQSGIIHDYAYQIIISTISLTLLLSPLWISVVKRLLFRS